MASLIVKLARGDGRGDAYHHDSSTPHGNTGRVSGFEQGGLKYTNNEREVALKTFTESRVRASLSGGRNGEAEEQVRHGGIQRTREFQVTVHHSSSRSMDEDTKGSVDTEDEACLTSNQGHPNT